VAVARGLMERRQALVVALLVCAAMFVAVSGRAVAGVWRIEGVPATPDGILTGCRAFMGVSLSAASGGRVQGRVHSPQQPWRISGMEPVGPAC
jgi:hypothetical protein